MKNKFISRLLSLVTIMVLLYSCRNEQLTEQETYNNSGQFRPTSKTIRLEESKHKLVLKTELQKAQENLTEIKTNTSGKSVDYANGVSIDTDNVTYIEVGPTFHTYTFNLVRENAPVDAPLENLVLSSLPDGTYKELLVTYNFTPQEKLDLLSGKGVKTAGKGTAIELTKGTYGGVISNRSMGVVESCSYKTVDMYFSCYTGAHNSGNESEWGGCKWKSEGGYPAQHITTVALVCTADTSLGIDGSPGGGDIGPTTGLGSGPNEGTPTTPTFATTKNTPCGKIKKSTYDESFKANITSLEEKTGLSYENGYRLGTSQTGTQNQLLQNRPGTTQVDVKFFPNTFAIQHTHYDGIYPIFSPGDILQFNQWIIWAKGWNDIPTNTPKIPLNYLTYTVVTSNGNYLMAFDGTDVVSLPNYTEKEFYDLNEKYKEKLNSAVKVTNVSQEVIYDMEKLEKEFLKFVKDKMNMVGFKLFKINSDGTNTEIYLENENRKTKQCP
ncbi:hypothetical protein [Chryseobacterium sp. MEBOG07]|uniref:hypothetical protein n=1 Tax=Chryseobacterium sp. MEBOG07 TaxID=2879939 RepID=UPI001F22F76B|nr:hypothetical protein [Chryseobacterium sp. MEBOG07]UKB80225.1 hypothetical protein LF886_04250 [Chryseobacterium sp. MEBOG07]